MDWSPVLCSLRPGEAWALDDCSSLRSLRWLSGTTAPSRAALRDHVETLVQRWADGQADRFGYPAESEHFTGRLSQAELRALRDQFRAARDADAGA